MLSHLISWLVSTVLAIILLIVVQMYFPGVVTSVTDFNAWILSSVTDSFADPRVAAAAESVNAARLLLVGMIPLVVGLVVLLLREIWYQLMGR